MRDSQTETSFWCRPETDRRTSKQTDSVAGSSCITSSPQTAPLLLPDITSLISARELAGISYVEPSKRLPFQPSGNSFNCLERSRALLSLCPGISYLRRLFGLPFFSLDPSLERRSFHIPMYVSVDYRLRIFFPPGYIFFRSPVRWKEGNSTLAVSRRFFGGIRGYEVWADFR